MRRTFPVFFHFLLMIAPQISSLHITDEGPMLNQAKLPGVACWLCPPTCGWLWRLHCCFTLAEALSGSVAYMHPSASLYHPLLTSRLQFTLSQRAFKQKTNKQDKRSLAQVGWKGCDLFLCLGWRFTGGKNGRADLHHHFSLKNSFKEHHLPEVVG